MLTLDPNPFGADLPCAPNIGVNQSLSSAAVRSALRNSDELPGLGRQQRQRNRTDAVHLQARQEYWVRASGIEIAWGADCAQ